MREFESDCAQFSEHWSRLDWKLPRVHLEEVNKPCVHRTPEAIDAHLQGILNVERRFEHHFLRMLERFKRCSFYLTLEYPTFQHYCENRLGISPSLGCSLVALSRNLRRLPTLAAALQAGRVNRSHAELIARVATRGTVDRWIAHASATTVRFLREDVRIAERMQTRDPEGFQRTGGFPASGSQSDAAGLQTFSVGTTRADAGDLQTFSVGTARADAGDLQTISVPSASRASEIETPAPFVPELLPLREQIQRMLRGRNDDTYLGKCSEHIRFKLSPEVSALWEDAWRAVSHLMGCMAGYDDVMEAVVDAFLSEHLREALEFIRRHPLLDRRGHRCANPTCSQRANLHGHHVIFRSRGGGDGEENIVYLCRGCHLRGVHEGWITVAGNAPDGLTWVLGARLGGGPHLVVAGRHLLRVAEAERHARGA